MGIGVTRYPSGPGSRVWANSLNGSAPSCTKSDTNKWARFNFARKGPQLIRLELLGPYMQFGVVLDVCPSPPPRSPCRSHTQTLTESTYYRRAYCVADSGSFRRRSWPTLPDVWSHFGTRYSFNLGNLPNQCLIILPNYRY